MERPLVIVPGGKERNMAQMAAAGAQPVTRAELEPYV